MKNLAPILLFVYNRVEHTKQCVESLLQSPLAEHSNLIIMADGARTQTDAPKVKAVREYISTIRGFNNITIEAMDENRGLANMIIYGVTKVVNIYGRVIVLEDDLTLSPHFIEYMNCALELYKDYEDVVNINGHLLSSPLNSGEEFFISFTNSWGWGTWRRGWELFNPNGEELLNKIISDNRCREFNMGYHFTRMLRQQIEGRNNSWAIRWYASIFNAKKVSLNAGVSLVTNNGFGSDATHCNTPNLFETKLHTGAYQAKKLTPIKESKTARFKLKLNYIIRTSYSNKLRVHAIYHINKLLKNI